MPFTRGNRKGSEMERSKSAIIDHVVKENHKMEWECASIVVKESDWHMSVIKN